MINISDQLLRRNRVGGTFPNPSVKTPTPPPTSCKHCSCHKSPTRGSQRGDHFSRPRYLRAAGPAGCRKGQAGSQRACTAPGKPGDYLLTCASATKEESSESLETLGKMEGGAESTGEEESSLGRRQQRGIPKIWVQKLRRAPLVPSGNPTSTSSQQAQW